MATYQQQKQKVLQLFQSALSLPQVPKNADTQKHLQEAKAHLDKEKLFVVVCGEFKQGKSSLLNALLNEPDLFPVDVDITTNLVSSITYGKQEKITVVVGEPGKQQAKEIQRSEIPDYVTEQRNQGNARKAQLLIIESPNPQLREGLVLVDTPGVGSLNTEHTAATYAFIPNADAILFVSDAFAPLSAKELEFIQDTITPHCQNLIFVVTKIDKVSAYETVVENNQEKLATVLGRPGNEIPIIPVSSKLKLEYLLSQNSEDLEDSKFALLETQLWQMIGQQRGQILLLRALSELGRVIAEIKQPMQVEWEAYQQNNQQQLDTWESQFQDAKLRLQNLLENNATWRSQLSDGLQDVRTQILEQLQDGFTAIRRQSVKYLDDRVLLESPEQIASLLEADIDSLMSNLGQQMGYLSANLQGKIEAVTSLSLNPFEASSLERQKTQFTFEDIQGKKPGIADKLMQMTRNATFSMSAAGTIGGVAGGVIGTFFGPVGTVPGYYLGAVIGGGIAGLIGLVTGAKEGLQQVQEKTKHTVSLIVKQFIEESHTHCSRVLSKAIKELENYMRDDLTAQIKREKENSDRTLRSLQDARKLSQEQGVQRAKELQVQLGQLNQLQTAVEQLAKFIVSSSTAETPPEALTPAPQARVAKQSKQSVTVGADSGDWANE